MNKNFISASNLAEKLSIHLKIATSVKAFDNYNSFYNIYTESDEPCRRIAVLTPYKDLEEVYDEYPDRPLNNIIMVDGNVWIKEYTLITNPKNINLDEILIEENDAKVIEKYFKE